MKDKIIQLINKLVNQVKPVIVTLDSKVTTLIPNPKIKKGVYIALGSMVGFMFLIIILGLLLSPFRKVNTNTSSVLNKPNIIVESPKPQLDLTENQKQILILGTEVKELNFPPTILNIPILVQIIL